VLRLDGKPADAAPLQRMNEAIVHRGPDDGHVMTDGPVGLANRRLAILDLRPEARLPMTRGPLTVAYNGEVYNFAQQREALQAKGHSFTTSGDTEVILALYREYGEAFVEHLDGMFALALWDAQRQVLCLGRDAAGKKPLYYYQGPDCLVFGSEIKSLLLHPDVPRRARREVLPLVLTYGYVPCPHTAYEGISALPPGQLMVVENRQVRAGARTFGARFHCTPGDGRPEEWTERILDTLREGVRERLVSDVPLGAFLSGGVDSSLVVALMAELNPGGVKTFCISFPDQPGWDEAAHAQRVADLFGTEHTVLEVDPPQVEKLIPRLLWHNDQPFGDESALPTLLLSEMTREHVTVALCGDAGDELFAGYPRFQQAQWVADGWPSWPGMNAAFAVGGVVAEGLCRVPVPAWSPLAVRLAKGCRRLRQGLPAAYCHSLCCVDERTFRRLWAGPSLGDPHHFYDQSFGDGGRDWLSRILDFNYQTYLLDDLLIKVDRMSMAASLEVRSPFLSDAMVRLASEVPTGLKLRGGVSKYILKEAARRYLPDDIVHRRKQGFGVPLAPWFRDPRLRPYLRDLLLDATAQGRGLYAPGSVETILAEHDSHRWDHARLIWNLCLIEQWFRMFIDPSEIVAP
jgi:asparagine synthase (glutamine-hydrolysing)